MKYFVSLQKELVTMTKDEAVQLGKWLLDDGYTRYSSLYDKAAFQISKTKKDEDDNLHWIISYKFYDFSMHTAIHEDEKWDVEINIHIGHGITEMLISYPRNLEDVERMADELYEFANKWDLINHYAGE